MAKNGQNHNKTTKITKIRQNGQNQTKLMKSQKRPKVSEIL